MVKFPEKSMAPPTVLRAGKEIASRAELLAIKSPPPMVFNSGMEMLAKSGLATNAKDPEVTEVKLGVLTLVK